LHLARIEGTPASTEGKEEGDKEKENKTGRLETIIICWLYSDTAGTVVNELG